LNNLDEKVK